MAISVYTSLLLKDYKRKAGEIKALRKEVRELAKSVLQKERELAALDTVIKSREPAIDLTSVKPIATVPKVLGLKWNRLTTLILSCLQAVNGVPVNTDIITDYVIDQAEMDVPDRRARSIIRTSVRYRLKNLATAGRVIRSHEKASPVVVMWSLPGSDE